MMATRAFYMMVSSSYASSPVNCSRSHMQVCPRSSSTLQKEKKCLSWGGMGGVKEIILTSLAPVSTTLHGPPCEAVSIPSVVQVYWFALVHAPSPTTLMPEADNAGETTRWTPRCGMHVSLACNTKHNNDGPTKDQVPSVNSPGCP